MVMAEEACSLQNSVGVVLAFSEGSRPCRETVRALMTGHPRFMIGFNPSFKPSARPASSRKTDGLAPTEWLELLSDGLSFDLIGLAPGPSAILPDISRMHGFEGNLPSASVEAVGLFPGPHIAESEASLPIFRAMMGLTAELIHALEGVQAICWAPARSAIHPAIFGRSVNEWMKGGRFPTHGLVGFDFERGKLRSEGLSFFAGREVLFDEELAREREEAIDLASRLVHEIVAIGPLEGPVELQVGNGRKVLLDPLQDAMIAVAAA